MSTRIQRPHPKRTQPIRNASAMLRGPRRTTHTHTHTHPGPGATPGAPGGGAVEAGVATAYRVYEDYMRRGREAAASGRFFDLGRASAPEGERVMNTDVQNITRMAMRYWSDAFAMWIDLVAPLVPQGMGDALRTGLTPPPPGATPAAPPSGAPAWTNPAAPPPGADPAVWTLPSRDREAQGANLSGGPGAAASPARVTVGVALSSPRPARVVVDLSPSAAGRTLTALPLNAIDGSAKAALTGVTLTPGGDGHVDVSVVIPGDQPAGTYVGAILDPERGTGAGTLTVVLSG